MTFLALFVILVLFHPAFLWYFVFVMQCIVRVRIYYNEQSDKTRFSNLLSIDNNTQIYIPSAEYTIRFIVSYFYLPQLPLIDFQNVHVCL